MKMNRIQFQPGLSMSEFFERYASAAQCQAALHTARWPNGFVCPKCGGVARSRFVRGGPPYWQCGACPHQTSVISGTIFESSKLSLARWFLAVQLLTQSKNNVSAPGTQAPARRELPQRLAAQTQDHAGHALGRARAPVGWAHRDRRRLPRWRVLRRQDWPGRRQQGALRRGGADHRGRPPLYACLSQQPPIL